MPQTTTFRQTANLLLLDDSEVAGLAMRGIVGRSRNRCVLATTIEAAWALLRELVVIDLVIVEIKLAQQNGADFISQVRADPVFGGIPIVVYTRVQDHSPAAKLRALGIQNYVIQPYHDEVVHAEIAAAGRQRAEHRDIAGLVDRRVAAPGDHARIDRRALPAHHRQRAARRDLRAAPR